jgi:hypothetical protein
MKAIVCGFVAAFTLAVVASAGDYVSGYSRSNGTYVAPHYKTSPNSTVQDNYSYRGNTNPYTGSTGSNYYRSAPSSAYYGGSSASSYSNSSGYRYGR